MPQVQQWNIAFETLLPWAQHLPPL